jgi:vancomycin resistance protein VanW
MRMAIQIFDGLEIGPGEVFSFWRLIGKPSERRGFKSGPTFHRGKILDTYGGGLCQISGLLYNLALESGMSILERYPHSIDAYGDRRYLPLGRDATVAFLSKDLTFKNVSSSTLTIRLRCDGLQTEGEIVSKDPMPYRFSIETHPRESIQANSVALHNRKYVAVQTQRKCFRGEVVISEEFFGTDIYAVPL